MSTDARKRPRAKPRPYMSESRFMGITELARLLGTTRDRVSGMVGSRQIPPCFLRIGQAQRWQRAHVEAWLETGTWPDAAWGDGK